MITLSNTNSGSEQPDKWKVKKMENIENESEPLIKLSLGICGSTLHCNSTPLSDDINWQKDKKFDRNVKVEIDDVDHHHHDSDQVVQNLGCINSSVVSFTEEQLKELKRQLIIFKYMVLCLPVPLQLLLPLWKSFSSSSVTTSHTFFLGLEDRSVYHPFLMDPEPGRCRRTDGKKWRCYQSVIPNEKYCEKHMHRGRKRSRKLVENTPADMAVNLNVPESNAGFEVTRILNQKTQQLKESSKAVVSVAGLANAAAKSDEGKHNRIMERITANNPASSLEFSPNSVLQDAELATGHRSLKVENHVQQRCQRTDGKSWQCSKDVLPTKKYCAEHIHRGTKKATNTTSTVFKFEQAKTGLHLNTELNISLATKPTEPRHNIIDTELPNSSSSSEATLSV